MFLLASEDYETSDAAYSWLNGDPLPIAEQRDLALRSDCGDAKAVVSSLSWLLGLAGPTLLAFDQLDAIVAELNSAAGLDDGEIPDNKQRRALSIIEGICGGLMGVWDSISRTQVVVSCLTPTWDILMERGLQSAEDRFRPAIMLNPITDQDIAKEIVYQRLAQAYEEANIKPPQPGYPFAPESFVNAVGRSPRQVLKACDRHREKCLRENTISFFPGFATDGEKADFALINPGNKNEIQQRFEQLCRLADPKTLLHEQDPDGGLVDALRCACRCLLKELDLPEDVDAGVDQEFSSRKAYETLHARIRLIYHQDNDRECHYSFRFLQHDNAIAFQGRLNAAMVASGIDADLPFRKLHLLRTTPLPGGKVTAKFIKEFDEAHGILHNPGEEELRALRAIYQLEKENPEGFASWLISAKPMSNLQLFREIQVEGKDAGDKEQGAVTGQADLGNQLMEETQHDKEAEIVTPPPGETVATAIPTSMEIPIGHRLLNQKNGEKISLPLPDFARHTVIIAGAGSGKTVMLRRLVEEAALAGIPSVVLDGANDLAQLGTPWPEPPEAWSAEDKARAERYHRETETIVWTPGLEKGNPLVLNPIPDLRAVANDPDDLNNAIAMTCDALQQMVAPGKADSVTNKRRLGVLAGALRFFTAQGLRSFRNLIDLLSELPDDAGSGINNAQKIAADMADSLRAETQRNHLLRQSGTPLDPATFFRSNHGKTRVSVVNLCGLPGLERQQQFVCQLAMTFFTWIKANPAKNEAGLQGLLIIDEAKDFVPSQKSAPSKEPLIRLAAQARKYGLGLLFATQAPKSIDNNVVINCTTHFYGKVNSPAAVETVESMLQDKGASTPRIAALTVGQFFLCNEQQRVPLKISTNLCLSHHPSNPPDEKTVLDLARASRERLRLS